MKRLYGIRYGILFAAFAAAAGCAGAPEENAMLEEARSVYNGARSDPQVMKNAPLELAKAEESLRTAEELWQEEEDRAAVEHHAYLARQQALVAREEAQLQQAREALADADAERVRVLLEVRAREAEAARQQAQTSQRELAEARERAEEQARAQRERELEEARQRAAGLEAELSELKAQPTERGMVLTLGDVLFDLDKAELKPGADRVMDRLETFLKEYPERRILVEGFTDSSGPEDYNQQLSEKRARAVREALMERGISGERIEMRGYGEQYPVASNESVAGRQQNRRVEILFSDASGQLPARR